MSIPTCLSWIQNLLSVFFLATLVLRKGIATFLLPLAGTSSLPIPSFKTTPFLPISTKHEHVHEDDDILVYTVTTCVAPHMSTNPPTLQVYSCRAPASHPRPASSSSANPSTTTRTLVLPSRDLSPNLAITLRKCKNQCTHHISSFASYTHLTPSLQYFISSLDLVLIPKCLFEALSHLGWCATMVDEMWPLNENGT